MALLELENVSYVQDNKYILRNISLKVEKGDFISVVGPSGSGKSTLFRICSHIISNTDGQISFKGTKFTEYNPLEIRRNICYCFQSPCLFGKKVMENMEFPYNVRKKTFDTIRVKELLQLFNLRESILEAEIKNLSGGEKQRISLIRSILFRPEILLLDEVTSALDKENVSIVENVVKSLNNDGITIMWITHDEEQSEKFSNKKISMENGMINFMEELK